MRLLPFIIIILASAIILKASNLIERFFKEPHIVITNVSEEKSLETPVNNQSSEPGQEEGKSTENKEDASHTKTAKNLYPNEDFIKECLSQKAKYTESELQILDNLSNKKAELDKRESNITEKEKLLAIAADQIEAKLKDLKDEKSSIQTLLAEYADKEDAKIDHLVRIYQNMKPDKAAKLFDTIDMDILIKVVNKMKESNSGAIISLMDPNKATELTKRLAEQKGLKEVPAQ